MSAEDFLQVIEYNQYNFFSDVFPVILLYFSILWLLFTLWVLKDIVSRTNNPIFIVGTFIFVLFANIPGLLLYLLLRPESTIEEAKALELYHIGQMGDNIVNCHNCGSIARKSFSHCTTCGVKLELACTNCDRQIDPIWLNCAHCGIRLYDTNSEILRANINVWKYRFVMMYYTISNTIRQCTRFIARLLNGISSIGKLGVVRMKYYANITKYRLSQSMPAVEFTSVKISQIQLSDGSTIPTLQKNEADIEDNSDSKKKSRKKKRKKHR